MPVSPRVVGVDYGPGNLEEWWVLTNEKTYGPYKTEAEAEEERKYHAELQRLDEEELDD